MKNMEEESKKFAGSLLCPSPSPRISPLSASLPAKSFLFESVSFHLFRSPLFYRIWVKSCSKFLGFFQSRKLWVLADCFQSSSLLLLLYLWGVLRLWEPATVSTCCYFIGSDNPRSSLLFSSCLMLLFIYCFLACRSITNCTS